MKSSNNSVKYLLLAACVCVYLICFVCHVHAVRVEDITTQNHYKNSAEQEQQVISRQTLSTALLETYEVCDAPPRLREFTQYRDDNRDGLTFFTNPAYFFDLWRHQQDQQIENRKRKKVGHWWFVGAGLCVCGGGGAGCLLHEYVTSFRNVITVT